MIETLLTRPYWVIDILPRQVPKDSAGQYSAIERYYLKEPQLTGFHRRCAAILLKLNCYYDLQTCFPEEDELRPNPSPDRLVSWLTEEHRDLCVVIPAENALITVNHDDTYMTVYNPPEGLLDLLEKLASSEGLFLWRPPQEGDGTL